MKTAKEIADLARATNVLNEAEHRVLHDAIGERLLARETSGESGAMEKALLSQTYDLCAHARRLDEATRDQAQSLADVRRVLSTVCTAESSTIGRLKQQSNFAPAHLTAVFDTAVFAWNTTVDLFEAVADLVRATPEEREAALAARKAEADARQAAAKPAKRTRRSQ